MRVDVLGRERCSGGGVVSLPDPTQGDEVPVDTLDAPHEPAAWTRPSVRLWIMLLSGPVVWIVHFAIVYLTVEAACAPAVHGRWSVLDERSLRVFVVVATVVAALACVVTAFAVRRVARRPGASPLCRAAVVLAAGSCVSVLAVGAPVLVLGPC